MLWGGGLEPFLNKAYNFYDTQNKSFLYQDPQNELQENIALYTSTYALYPVLYFFGFGNGLLYKILLQDKNKIIVVFECQMELLKLALSLCDFSKELTSKRLVILDSKELSFNEMQFLFSNKPYFDYIRVYTLHLHCDFYGTFEKEILRLNSHITKAIKDIILKMGNDSNDILLGIFNLVSNLNESLSHADTKEFVRQRKNLCENAIIVSTGPSLSKQLELLKQYNNKAMIFAADSAYPILARAGIKPDFVSMVERTAFTAEFFNHDFKDFDKEILFCLASVVHPNVLTYLKNKNYMLIHKISSFARFLSLHAFGYLNNCQSVAHMNLFLAAQLGFKNIAFIGQDLAYDEKGFSHPQDYQNSADYESNLYSEEEKLEVLAYGGLNTVKTHIIWQHFKTNLEALLQNFNTHIKFFNCTEGGARIFNCKELPFKDFCETFLHNELNKNFNKLKPLSQNKQDELKLKAYHKVRKTMQQSQAYEELALSLFENLQKDANIINNASDPLAEKALFDKDYQVLENFKIRLLNEVSLNEIIGLILTQFELNLKKIAVLNPLNKEDAINKMLLYLREHLYLLELIIAHLKALKNTLKEAILPLEQALIKAGFKKYLRK